MQLQGGETLERLQMVRQMTIMRHHQEVAGSGLGLSRRLLADWLALAWLLCSLKLGAVGLRMQICGVRSFAECLKAQ